MAETDLPHFTKNQSTGEQEATEEDKLSQDCKELILSLPREKGGWRSPYLYLFQGFWFPPAQIQAINTFQRHFQAKDSDVVVASFPKSGTTWLKALTFAIVNRQHFSSSKNHPLLTSFSHDLVPFFEFNLYGDYHVPDLSNMKEPRLFGSHIPFPLLAKSIKESKCRIVYICRNPFDILVSSWIFYNHIKREFLPGQTQTLEEAFEMYCRGAVRFGPSWDQMLGYWNESIARPDKVLFLKYEELQDDVEFHVKRVAEFLGCPFTQEEESSGVLGTIVKLCSFEKMKELEVNKSGTYRKVETKHFFRKAEVGDWVNYLSPSMVEKLSKIIEEKLHGSGLSFKVCS